ncbi:MAG TPA: hypothetical protein DD413_00115 [Ruminococcus sp.]|nr:hypothetical protein [Ruminococcus sp.]
MRTKFKKLTSVCLAVIMILSVLTVAPFTVSAEETESESVGDTYTSGDFKYEVLNDGTAIIKDYKGSATELKIPSTLGGHTVTEIGEYAFRNCTSLKGVTISDSVTEIGVDAFRDCTSLEFINVASNNLSYSSVDGVLFNKDKTELIRYPAKKESISYIIPNTVTSIVWYAFMDSTNLKSVTISDSVTEIGRGVFLNCPSLESVTISNNLKVIRSSVFESCPNLKSVTIPSSVTKIGSSAFSYCLSLESVTIPNSVTAIGSVAFYHCRSLVSVTIPISVETIGSCAFGYLVNRNETGFDLGKPYEGFIVYGKSGTAAESYANKNGFNFVPTNEYTDINSQIMVTAATDAELKVAEITDEGEIEQVNLKLENERVESLYDISFVKDGTTVQPDCTVTVKIPCTNENSKVYHVETDSSLTDMRAVYDNGYMVFSTNHFSLYALTSEKSDVMLGDVDGDGKISIDDVTDIQKHLANIVDFTNEQESLADVDRDGKITIDDVTLIQKSLAGLAVIE